MLEEATPSEASTGSTLSRKATLLMAEILQTANRVLPLQIAAKIQVKFYADLCLGISLIHNRHYREYLVLHQTIIRASTA